LSAAQINVKPRRSGALSIVGIASSVEGIVRTGESSGHAANGGRCSVRSGARRDRVIWASAADLAVAMAR
jgi:hypothetical protein